MAVKKTNVGEPEPSGLERAGDVSSIEGVSPTFSGGRFLSRAQRNQAAFINAVTGRCSCKDVENCADCNANAWSGQLLASDSGQSSPER